MTVSSADIVNEALQLFGDDGPPVTGVAPNFDSSAAGKAAAKVYVSTVATVARQFSWDFSRQNITLVLTGNTAPFPWSYEYIYPSNCVQIWQLAPASLSDTNDPQPVSWAVGNAVVSGTQSRVIWTNMQAAFAICNGNPAESTWDSLFRETVTRLLASKLSMALAGKPDVSQSLLETTGAFQGIGTERDS
jgi:hypothetical protein